MVQLRKNCNHPDLLESAFDGSCKSFAEYSSDLKQAGVPQFEPFSSSSFLASFYPPINQIVDQCGKFCLPNRLLVRLFAQKHKVLIFSQWTKILDIMDYYFSEKGFEVCRIDGSVRLDERKRKIQEFIDVNSNYRVFLLSTRAGGLGINLTAADTCILYDSDWEDVLLALLRDEEDAEDKMIQIDISNEDLERLLDRRDLIVGPLSEDGKPDFAVSLLPLKGPGWEVVMPTASGGMLSALNS